VAVAIPATSNIATISNGQCLRWCFAELACGRCAIVFSFVLMSIVYKAFRIISSIYGRYGLLLQSWPVYCRIIIVSLIVSVTR